MKATKNKILNIDEFKSAIESYKDVINFTDDLNDLFVKYGCCGDVCPPTGSGIIIDLLESIFDDKSGWISYWVFELKFGEDYQDGYVKDKDGNNISLKTADDLYDLLVENMEEN